FTSELRDRRVGRYVGHNPSIHSISPSDESILQHFSVFRGIQFAPRSIHIKERSFRWLKNAEIVKRSNSWSGLAMETQQRVDSRS
ncbi:MAG: hypothetical protein WA857_15810, partial [Candidatus Acidiferrum sp.]